MPVDIRSQPGLLLPLPPSSCLWGDGGVIVDVLNVEVALAHAASNGRLPIWSSGSSTPRRVSCGSTT